MDSVWKWVTWTWTNACYGITHDIMYLLETLMRFLSMQLKKASTDSWQSALERFAQSIGESNCNPKHPLWHLAAISGRSPILMRKLPSSSVPEQGTVKDCTSPLKTLLSGLAGWFLQTHFLIRSPEWLEWQCKWWVAIFRSHPHSQFSEPSDE